MAENPRVHDSTTTTYSIEDEAKSAELHWFAIYTVCRHEKRIAQHFENRKIEFYLPLYRAQRRWKDRPNVTLDLPLFPGYIFARVDRPQRVNVLQVPGVLSIVGGTGSRSVPLPEFEIEALRRGLDPLRAEPHPLLSTGQRVRIRRGALAGIEGIVVRKRSNLRVVLTLELIMQSISLEVDGDDLEPVSLFPPRMRVGRHRDCQVRDRRLQTHKIDPCSTPPY